MGRFWDRWLRIAVTIVGLYGLALVVAGPAVAAAFDLLGFGPAGGGIADGPPRDYVLFVYGVLGAVIAGWMATLLVVVAGPLTRRDSWAWWAVASGVGVWFTVDTVFSLAVGQVSHAVFNLAFVAVIVPPLVAIRSELGAQADRPTLR